MEKNELPNQPRLVGINGGLQESPFAETGGLDFDGTEVRRTNGSIDYEASNKKLMRSMTSTPLKRIGAHIAGLIVATDRRGFVRTSVLVGRFYDYLCARVKGFDDSYYLIVRAKTPIDWARINRMPVMVFCAGLGYSLTDTPSFKVRTLKSRWKLELPPETRELVDLVKKQGQPSTTR